MDAAEQKKMVVPFLQRAEEVQKAEPKIAYYCRLYAVEQALHIPKDVRLPEITAVVGAVMGALEKARAGGLELGKDDALYCENFALTVFARADRADRAGRSDKSTALTFYAASFFFEILNQFGEMLPDLLEKQRYAAWRAADINKAIKEGRTPAPPAPKQAVNQEDQALLDSLGVAPSADMGAEPSGTLPAAPQQPPAPEEQPPGEEFEGAEPEDHGLPSPPKSLPTPRPAAAGVPPPPRTYQPFQKVLFCGEDGGVPQRGTVAKVVEPGGSGAPPTYFVALKGTPKHPGESWMYRIAPASASQLALEISKGDRVQYSRPSGGSVEATVAEVDVSHWPPSYLIQTSDGSYVDTEDVRLTPLVLEQPPEEELQQLIAEQQAQQARAVGAAGAAAPAPLAPQPLPAAGAAAAQPSAGGPPSGAFAPPPGPPAGSSTSAVYPAAPQPPPPFASSPPSATAPTGAWVGGSAAPAAGAGAAAAAAPPSAYPPPPGAGAGGATAAGTAPQPPARQPSSAGASQRAPLYPPGPPAAGAAAAAAAAHAPPHPPAAAPAAAAAAAPPSFSMPQPVAGFMPSLHAITEAQKLAKTAASALSFEDVPTAVKQLTEALTMLTQPSAAAAPPRGGGGRR